MVVVVEPKSIGKDQVLFIVGLAELERDSRWTKNKTEGFFPFETTILFQSYSQSAIESIFLFYRTPVHLVDDLAVVTLIGEDTK